MARAPSKFSAPGVGIAVAVAVAIAVAAVTAPAPATATATATSNLDMHHVQVDQHSTIGRHHQQHHHHRRHDWCGAEIHPEHLMSDVNRRLDENRAARERRRMLAKSTNEALAEQSADEIWDRRVLKVQTGGNGATDKNDKSWWLARGDGGTASTTTTAAAAAVNVNVNVRGGESLKVKGTSIESFGGDDGLGDASVAIAATTAATTTTTTTTAAETTSAALTDTAINVAGAESVDASNIIEIQVHVHIIEPTENDLLLDTIKPSEFEYVSDQAVATQIAILNRAFEGRETVTCSYASEIGLPESAGPSAVSPFRFVHAVTERYRNTEWYVATLTGGDVTGRVELDMKRKTHKGDCSTLNVWIKYTGEDDYGWVHNPWRCKEDLATMEQDGIVFSASTMPGGSKEFFNEGDTLVHEVGHWLGLYHTFHGGCQGDGDHVDDTPPQKKQGWSCKDYGQKSCSRNDIEGAVDPITNFMDYTQDCCLFQFTEGQVQRMIDTWEVYRYP